MDMVGDRGDTVSADAATVLVLIGKLTYFNFWKISYNNTKVGYLVFLCGYFSPHPFGGVFCFYALLTKMPFVINTYSNYPSSVHFFLVWSSSQNHHPALQLISSILPGSWATGIPIPVVQDPFGRHESWVTAIASRLQLQLMRGMAHVAEAPRSFASASQLVTELSQGVVVESQGGGGEPGWEERGGVREGESSQTPFCSLIISRLIHCPDTGAPMPP